eukprot:jgi/Picsp_1/5541/NSC_02900-R1_protein
MTETENISVFVRVRPLSEGERGKSGGGRVVWKADKKTIFQHVDCSTGNSLAEPAAPIYTLDTVFDSCCSTKDVYESTTKGLIQQVIEGFNSTVFAYGQTSSGKTHTMRGNEEEPGIIPQAIQEIFNLINNATDREFLLRMSYMEIYNEDIKDLLAPGEQKLQVHESRESGVYVAGLREEIASTPSQVMDLLSKGEEHRHVGETRMNKSSSRSHTIFRMVIESRSRNADDDGAIRVSTLTLVDLAGSERVSKTGAEGQRMKEGAAINKSLLTLGTVINKLSEGAAASGAHIPYRDSKLTRILQPSLGGNAKTAIICAITPASQHAEESHSTLRFACRAKRVVNIATVNEVLSDAAVLKRQAHEIEELRKKLESSGKQSCIDQEVARLREQMLRKDQENDLIVNALAAEKEERERAQRKVESITRMMLESQEPEDDPVVGRKRKDARRDTWCPGALAGKRPLLNHKDPTTQRTRQQLKDAEDELMAVADEKDKIVPSLQESQWKVRQLEKDLAFSTQSQQEALEQIFRLKEERNKAEEMKKEQLAQSSEERQRAIAELETLKAQIVVSSESSLQIIESKAEIEKLTKRCQRFQKGEEQAQAQVDKVVKELESLKSEFTKAKVLSEKSENKIKELDSEIDRLNSHIGDLEKRKRAPLYQKKQEEELKAANTRAKEAERNASEAENKLKIFENELENRNSELKAEKSNVDKICQEYEARITEMEEEHKALSQKLGSALELAATRQAQLTAESKEITQSSLRKEGELLSLAQKKEEEVELLNNKVRELQSKMEELNAQMEETQACADAASSHIRFLEEKSEKEVEEAEVERQRLVAQHQQEAESFEQAIKQQEMLLETAKLENEALQAVNQALEESNDQLEKRVKYASSTLNAADELRELKRKHKEEISRLNQSLKTANLNNRCQDKSIEKASKECDRIRNQLKDAESKLKAEVVERSNAQSEKAATERELRTLKAKLEKVTKSLDRLSSIEEKKRQSLKADIDATKDELLNKAQELEQCLCELESTRSEASGLSEELEMYGQNIKSLKDSISDKEQLIDILQRDLDELRHATQFKNEEMEAKIESLQGDLAASNHDREKLQSKLSDLQTNFDSHQDELKALERSETKLQEEIGVLKAVLVEAESKIQYLNITEQNLEASRQKEIQMEDKVSELHIVIKEKDETIEKGFEANLGLQKELEHLSSDVQERIAYIASLETQVNELVAQNMETEAVIAATQGRVSELEQQCEQHKKAFETQQLHTETCESALLDLKTRYSEKEKDIEKMGKAYVELQETIAMNEKRTEALSKALATEKASNIDSSASLKAMKVSFEAEKREFGERIQEMEKKQQQHMSALQAGEEEIEALKTRVRETEEDRDRRMQDLTSSHESQRAQSLAKLENMEKKLFKTESVLEQANQQLSDLTKQAKLLAASNTDLNSELESAKSTYEDLMLQAKKQADDEQAKLLQQQDSLKAEVASLKYQVGQLSQCTNLKEMAVNTEQPSPEKEDVLLKEKFVRLEQELRRSRRREEKLQALQYRLQEDVRQSGGSMDLFTKLKDIRTLEYEMDRAANKAEKEICSLRQALQHAQTSTTNNKPRHALADKENIVQGKLE